MNMSESSSKRKFRKQEKIMTKKDFDEIFTKLLELFPNPDTELNFETPFQLLIAVMLSAQTTDKQVNVVTDKLFLKIKNPNDVLNMTEEKLAKQVSSVNYYKTKTKHIRESAQRLVDLFKDKKTRLTKNEKECLNKYGYYLPENIELLTRLPWVGEKTAKVILYVRYKHNLIAVDTHVHRVANRLWIVKTNEPLETSKKIEKAIPKKWKRIAHHSLILFWRYYCTAKKPKCENCVLKKWCKNPEL